MLRSLSLLLLLIGQTVALADTPLSGSLGRWLRVSAAPEIAEKLNNHPRFKGETVRLSAMHDSRLVAKSNGLVTAIERELTVLLNRGGRLQLSWPGATRSLTQTPIHLVLGIEIQPHGRNQHQVTLAMIDVNEGVWVNGLAFRWQGYLTRGERQLLTGARGARTVATPSLHSDIIKSLHLRDAKPVPCKGGTQCGEVDLVTKHGAHVALFTIRKGQLAVFDCSAITTWRDEGHYRFRIPVDTLTGFYAVSTQHAETQQRLSKQLKQAASNCNAGPVVADQLADRLGTLRALDWRATHLYLNNARVAALRSH